MTIKLHSLSGYLIINQESPEFPVQFIIMNIQYIDFQKNIEETGSTDYTYTQVINLSDFGPGGKWEVGFIYVIDQASLRKEQYETLHGFIYYPKYPDTTPPVFESITFEPDEV